MNTFDPVTGTFRNPTGIPPYASSNLRRCRTPQHDVVNPPPFQSSYTPLNQPFHQRRRGLYYYNPHHLRHQNQPPHPQWRSYRHVRSEESLRPEAVRPRPEQGFRGFQRRHPGFNEASGVRRSVSPELGPVSPLGQFWGSEVEYEPGYAETIPDGDNEVDDGDINGAENLNSRGLEDMIREANQAQTAKAFQSSDSLLDARWQDVLAREARLAVREPTFRKEQQKLTNERAKLAREIESLDWKRQELENRENQLLQLHLELQIEQQLLGWERYSWKDRAQRELYMRKLRRRAADMDDERVRFEENLGADFLDDEELDKCWEEECEPLGFS